MITLEDKLDIFYKMIFKEEEERSKKALEELEANNKLILESKKIELENKKEEIIERRRLLAEIQKNELLSKYNQEDRNAILIKKEEALGDLIKSLEDKARSFTSTEEYKDYILHGIEDVIKDMEEKEVTIGLIEEDKLRFEDFILKLGKEYGKNIIFDIVSNHIIGGFILKYESYNLDSSFKTIIDENRYLIGKRLYSSLEKTGELNG
ncbi:V-type ATP synthase subunit E [Tissierella sp.]|uniref:V-type ATP synthase subunit E n=1 Tax=Tissierella sp. TaxID=41274 RepID=UPI00285A7FA2|nr:V-type ATP synthase subunit E [Tissierella sp.]MDR7857396.1 V-type ATP synthase subunit E [Tissierella sp.]